MGSSLVSHSLGHKYQTRVEVTESDKLELSSVMSSCLVSYSLGRKYQTSVEVTDSDKHCSE